MIRNLLTLFFIMSLTMSHLAAGEEPFIPESIDGIWSGTLTLGGNSVALKIEFTKDDSGAYSAYIVPAKPENTALTGIVVALPSVSFQLATSGMPIDFRGELAGDRISGPLLVGQSNQQVGSLSLTRE